MRNDNSESNGELQAVPELSTEHLKVSRTSGAGEILVMRLDRHERRNAVDPALAADLHRAMDFLEEGIGVRAGILTGSAEYFSAGSDLTPGPRPVTAGGEYGFLRRNRTRPLVAAVEGYAFGGGFEMVLACDLVVAAESAEFALPEILRGAVAACGGLFRTHDRLPVNVATELVLTAARLDAVRAYGYGLVNRVAAPGKALDQAIALCREVTAGSPTSVAAGLRAISAYRHDAEPLAWELTAEALREVKAGPDWDEGIVAFFEKRAPRWQSGRQISHRREEGNI